jgi:hypothetical protein
MKEGQKNRGVERGNSWRFRTGRREQQKKRGFEGRKNRRIEDTKKGRTE